MLLVSLYKRLTTILISLVYILFVSFEGTTSRKIRHPQNPFSVPSQKPPELHLFAYNLQDSSTIESTVLGLDNADLHFQDECVTRNESDYKLTNDLGSFTISCQAPYPIKWVFPHKEHIINNLHRVLLSPAEYRISEFADHLEEPNTKSFRIYLEVNLHIADFFSVTFSCEANDDPEVNSKAHFYSIRTHEIENQGSTLQVNVSATEDVVLPCRPADPEANILLDKQVQVLGSNTTSWARLQLPNRYVTFSPKIGFTIKRSYVGYLQTNLFKCSLQDGDDGDYVFINITSENVVGKKDIGFQAHSTLEGKAQADFDKSEDMVFKCCSGVADKPPVATIKTCNTPTDCELLGQFLQKTITGGNVHTSRYSELDRLYGKLNPSDCAVQSIFLEESVVAICSGENVDFAEIYIKTYGSVNNKTFDHGNTARLSAEYSYEVASNVHNLAVKHKIKIKLATSFSLTKIRLNGIRVFWDIGNFSDPIPATFIWKDFKPRNVELVGMRDVYEGDPVHFACSHLTYVYSHGGHFRVNWKNGSRSVVEVESMTTFYVYENNRNNADILGLGSFVEMTSDTESVVASKAVRASLEMVSVDCYVPIMGSKKWNKQTLALDFQPSVKPKFSGAEEEIVYFGLHETGHRINCELVKGKPIPRIDLTKDGKVVTGDVFTTKLNSTFTQVFHANETMSNTSRTIEFPPISHEMQGVYICTAKNVRGKAVKTVKVFIQRKHTHATQISASVIFLACVLLLGVGLCYLVQRRKVTFLRSGSEFRLF